jgi:hypothetical protein
MDDGFERAIGGRVQRVSRRVFVYALARTYVVISCVERRC